MEFNLTDSDISAKFNFAFKFKSVKYSYLLSAKSKCSYTYFPIHTMYNVYDLLVSCVLNVQHALLYCAYYG